MMSVSILPISSINLRRTWEVIYVISVPLYTTSSVTKLTNVSFIIIFSKKDGSSASTNFISYFTTSTKSRRGSSFNLIVLMWNFSPKSFLFRFFWGLSWCIVSISDRYLWHSLTTTFPRRIIYYFPNFCLIRCSINLGCLRLRTVR